ncbi:MAG: glycosyltransferase family 39 protein [Chloroflexi bacterium]|nr:glycosyltransferase family 39 protein [Chloroflexota bacterium]
MISEQLPPNEAEQLESIAPQPQTAESDFQEKPAPRPEWQTWGVAALLAFIVLLGAIFRFTGVNWDEGTHLHPDERFLTMVTSTISWPGSQASRQPPPGCGKWGRYFDTACSPLDPYSYQEFPLFVYGTFPIFLTRFIGEIVEMSGYDQIHLVGRVLSALFDLSTVVFVFFIGRRMYGVRAGLLGAFFLAASVLDIQQSHFFTVDTFTNVPILVAFWYALDIADGKKWPAFVFAGIAFGFALAGRINIAPFAAVLVAASALCAYLQAVASTQTQPERLEFEENGNGADGPVVASRTVGPVTISYAWRENAARVAQSFGEMLSRTATRAFVGLAATAIIALILFRIGQPYAANGPGFIAPHIPKLDLSHGAVNFLFDVALSWAGGVNPKFADNMSYVSELVAGKIDAPPGHQWTDRTPYVFPFENMVRWGLGPPLGLAAWAGFLLALYQLIRYRRWQHLLIVVWVGVTFGYTGQQYVKTMRYFLQIYPFLALLAGWFIVELWDMVNLRSPISNLLAKGAVGLASIAVIGYTLFWAGAFTSIYTRHYTRVAASEWIYDNVPPGSKLGNEVWDDPMPTRVEGKDPFGGMYTGIDMSWYDEDTPEKRVKALGWLDAADYIILSSNRLYGSIPRLPMRYPLTVKYYEWLFDGTLGFQNVAEFTSRPQLLGIEINDDNAEEAYTVYDHPKVLIFKKTPQYSRAKAEALFNSVDLSEVYRFTPMVATQAETALLLTPDQREAQMRGGTWSEIFDPKDWSNQIPVIGWLAVIEILGWLFLPIAFIVFRGLVDRGFVFAKALGILLPAWGAWMLASYRLVEFSRLSIIFVVLFIILASALVTRFRWRDLLAFARARWQVILVEEILFLAFFGLFLAIRYGNPDLWHPSYGGEKPMDFAYLNAIVKSTWFPPYDPWFAGGYINYYYFGHLITAALIRLSGIVPEVAYNLALPMYFALLAMGAFSVVLNLVERVRGPTSSHEGFVGTHGNSSSLLFGLLGALFVAVIGNSGEVVLIGQVFMRIGGGGEGQSGPAMLGSILTGIARVVLDGQPFEVGTGSWYWNATRVIPDTINEFPFFTFLYADLHAHLMALPFTLLVMGVAINFVLRERDDDARLPFWPHWQIAPLDVIEVVIAALAVGSLRAINYADYVTYPLVVASGLVIGEYARRRRVDWDGIVAVAWRLIAIVALSSLLYQPFVSNFATTSTSIELWKDKRTTLPEYLTVHGIFLFVIATFLIWQILNTRAVRGLFRFGRIAFGRSARFTHLLQLHRAIAKPATWFEDLLVVAIAAAVVIEGIFILAQLSVFALAFPLIVIAGLLVLDPDLAPAPRFVALLIAMGLALTLAVELIRYKDDIGRMNTVFKFYLQVWVIFAIAAAAGLAFILKAKPPHSHTPILPTLWWAAFALLLFAGFLYPVLATRAKVNDRFVAAAPAGLNGVDYMLAATYQEQNRDIPLVYDHDAIEWLRENVPGSPVVLEANGALYHFTSRVAINTGLPTVIGWDWHQKQQRSVIDGAIIDHRIQDVRTIYSTPNTAEAVKLLNRYRVSYVYVGDLEQLFYDPRGIAKFDAMARAGQLELVYQNERVKIYRVIA